MSAVLVAALVTAAVPESVEVFGERREVTFEAGKALVISEPIRFTAEGPGYFELVAWPLHRKAGKKPATHRFLVERGDGARVEWRHVASASKRSAIKSPQGYLGTVIRRHLKVFSAQESFTFEVRSGATVLLQVKSLDYLDGSLAVGLPDPNDNWGTDRPSAAAASAPRIASPAHQLGAEARTQGLGIVAPGAVAAPQTSSDALQPVAVAGGDGSVVGASAALAEAVVEGYQRLGYEAPFHRVAVPYFAEIGEATAESQLGRVVSELLAVELANRKPFVLIERERVDQIMREHRLAGLGIVDEGTAAEFGKVLGAQSLLSGSVQEVGAEFLVTVRQVEVETGRVLVAGSVSIGRDNLIALSADAVVTRTVVGAAARSALIPGWGQYYNGEVLKGAVFAGTAVATLGTLFYYAGQRAAAKSDYDGATDLSPAELAQVREDANAYGRGANVALGVYAGVWLYSVVDAVLNGRDASEINVGQGPLAAVQATPTGFQVRF